jgi:hypothetical protein
MPFPMSAAGARRNKRAADGLAHVSSHGGVHHRLRWPSASNP